MTRPERELLRAIAERLFHAGIHNLGGDKLKELKVAIDNFDEETEQADLERMRSFGIAESAYDSTAVIRQTNRTNLP